MYSSIQHFDGNTAIAIAVANYMNLEKWQIHTKMASDCKLISMQCFVETQRLSTCNEYTIACQHRQRRNNRHFYSFYSQCFYGSILHSHKVKCNEKPMRNKTCVMNSAAQCSWIRNSTFAMEIRDDCHLLIAQLSSNK